MGTFIYYRREDESKSGGSTKINEGREGVYEKNLDLMRGGGVNENNINGARGGGGVYENNINGARGGSMKINLMEPVIHFVLQGGQGFI